MKKLLLSVVCFLTTIIGYGQTMEGKQRLLDPDNYANGMVYIEDNELQLLSADLSDYEVLDTTEYVATYSHRHPYLPIHKEETLAKGETMRLEIGRAQTAFFSEELFDADSSYTVLIQRKTPRKICTNSRPYYLYGTIQNGEKEIINRIYFHSGEAIAVKELIRPAWVIDSLNCEILGYKSWRASAVLGGRKWIVWFTPEIPLSTGPWKLCGLPGLILRAEDAENLYSFNIISIERRQYPLKKYHWHCKPMNRQEWLKFEKRAYTSPYSVFGGSTLIISGKKRGCMDESWTIPYNPIEWE